MYGKNVLQFWNVHLTVQYLLLDVHVQCLVERVLHVCVCVDVHVQCLVERVLHVCLCGCSCPVFG